MNKKAQIWVETVIYTLIGLSIIGIVLGIVKPAIEERQDTISIKQSIETLNYLDGKVSEVVSTGTGNTREVNLKIGKGKMIIDSRNESIMILIEKTKSQLSEPGQEILVGGNVKAITIAKGKTYDVALKIDYKNKLNLTYKNQDSEQILQQASIPYDIWIKNNGVSGNLTNINFY